MKIFAPIIAIMAATSSVASAARRTDDEKAPFCQTTKLFLGRLLAGSTLRVFETFYPGLPLTYGGTVGGQLEPSQVVLNDQQAILFQDLFFPAGFAQLFGDEYEGYNLLMKGDLSPVGDNDNHLNFPELAFAMFYVLAEPLNCEEADAAVKGYQEGVMGWMNMMMTAQLLQGDDN